MQTILNGFFRGISIILKQSFTDCNVYFSKQVQQDLRKPAFFIELINSSTKDLLLGNDFSLNNVERTFSFDITYYPKDNYQYSEINSVMIVLPDLLRVISVNGQTVYKINGLTRSDIYDTVGHFYITYKIITTNQLPIDEDDFMQTKQLFENIN
jgi:hypothetical protein